MWNSLRMFAYTLNGATHKITIMESSGKVLMYTFATPGPSGSFRPLVSLKGFEKLDHKDAKRFHELMNQIKYECLKLDVHFEAKIFETSDINTHNYGI